MKHRLNHETEVNTDEESTTRQDESMTFTSVDALMQHDAANTPVPPGLQDRVMRSAALISRDEAPSPWWKRWMPF